MGQAIKLVCVCASVCPSVPIPTITFLDRFSPILAQTKNNPKINKKA